MVSVVMPEELLDHVQGDSGLNQPRRERVAQVVPPDVGHPGLFRALRNALMRFAASIMPPCEGGEHVPRDAPDLLFASQKLADGLVDRDRPYALVLGVKERDGPPVPD